MKVSKKIPVFFLLAALITPVLFSISLQLKIFYIKIERKERLERNMLQTVSIPKTQVHWMERDREMLIGNELFDVEEYTIAGDYIIVKGLFDRQETAIEQQIEQTSEGQKSKEGDRLFRCFELVAYNYFERNPWSLNHPVIVKSRFYAKTDFYKKDFYIKVPSPPPQG